MRMQDVLRRLRQYSEQLRPHAAKAMKARAYHEIFDTPTGEIVLRDLLREAGLLSAETGKFAGGKRAMGLYIVEMLAWTEADVALLAERQTGERLSLLAEEAA